MSDDAVIFIEDGTYCLLGRDLGLPTARIQVLAADVQSRGLENRIHSSIPRISYQALVLSCCDANSISSWF